MEMSRDINRKRKESPYMEKPRDKDQRSCIFKYRIAAPNRSLTFIHKNKSLPSATSILLRSPMAYNTTAFLNKLTCTDYVDFGKCQDRFRQFSWSKIDFNYLVVEVKVFEKDDIKEFRLV